MDTSLLWTVHLVPEMPKIIHSLNLYNKDYSVKWTLGSVPLVSVLKRFDSHTDTSVKQTLGSVPLVSALRRFDCNTDTSVMWTLGTVPLVSVLRRFDCNTETSVKRTLGSVPLVCVLKRFDCNTDTSVKWTLGSVPLTVRKRLNLPPFCGSIHLSLLSKASQKQRNTRLRKTSVEA